MGLLAKLALEPEKVDATFTIVEIKALDTGYTTTIRVLDEQYSKNGDIVKVEELPSFCGEWGIVYMEMMKFYFNLAHTCEDLVRAGRFR